MRKIRVKYQNGGEDGFDLRAAYSFRRRLKTGRLRMDSTEIASNIRCMGRVQLLVEMLQAVYRFLPNWALPVLKGDEATPGNGIASGTS